MKTGLAFFLYVLFISCNSGHSAGDQSLNGKTIFKSYCVSCHGIDGSLMTNGAKDLRTSELNLDERILVITKGRNIMSSFENTLSKNQIKAVAEYTLQLKQ